MHSILIFLAGFVTGLAAYFAGAKGWLTKLRIGPLR